MFSRPIFCSYNRGVGIRELSYALFLRMPHIGYFSVEIVLLFRWVVN